MREGKIKGKRFFVLLIVIIGFTIICLSQEVVSPLILQRSKQTMTQQQVHMMFKKYVQDINLPDEMDDQLEADHEYYYNIGMLYYSGDESIPLKKNKNNAFKWFKLAAYKGSFLGAIKAGDMARKGEGTWISRKAAFDFYQKALEIKCDSIAYERLAYCYEKGIGTLINKKKAKEYYFKAAEEGNIESLYELSKSRGITKEQSILLLKAASSLDYPIGYFDTEYKYRNLKPYMIGDSKLKAIKHLEKMWANETDPVVTNLKKISRENNYFSKDFVEELVKTSYTYDYYDFANKYATVPNLDLEDVKNIKISVWGNVADLHDYYERMVKEYDLDHTSDLYKLDFDRDGEDEIGIPIYVGQGKAFRLGYFIICKQHDDGIYYLDAPIFSDSNSPRIISYGNATYFTKSTHSELNNTFHNILACTVDGNSGELYELRINGSGHEAKEIMTYVCDPYHKSEEDSLIQEFVKQGHEAVAMTKDNEMYNPNDCVRIGPIEAIPGSSHLRDVYFTADIDNDRVKEFIRKGHVLAKDTNYNLFQVYDSETKLLEEAELLLNMLPSDGYNGLHTEGSIYDLIPIGGKIVQLWTYEKDDKTYSLVLTKKQLLYGLHDRG